MEKLSAPCVRCVESTVDSRAETCEGITLPATCLLLLLLYVVHTYQVQNEYKNSQNAYVLLGHSAAWPFAYFLALFTVVFIHCGPLGPRKARAIPPILLWAHPRLVVGRAVPALTPSPSSSILALTHTFVRVHCTIHRLKLVQRRNHPPVNFGMVRVPYSR